MLSRRMLAHRSSFVPLVLAAMVGITCASPGRTQTAGAQDQAPPPANPSAPQSPAHKPTGSEASLELTLEEALKIAIDHDLGLKIEDVARDVAGYEYAGTWGSFDPRLTARAGVSNTEFEANSSLSGATVIKEDTQEFSTGLKFPLTTGGEFD